MGLLSIRAGARTWQERTYDRHRAEVERFDALITDVVLPGRSGADRTESARQTLPSLPVVLMTGSSDDEVRRRGANRPTAALLRKPFQIPELARALRAVLDASPDPAPPAG